MPVRESWGRRIGQKGRLCVMGLQPESLMSLQGDLELGRPYWGKDVGLCITSCPDIRWQLSLRKTGNLGWGKFPLVRAVPEESSATSWQQTALLATVGNDIMVQKEDPDGTPHHLLHLPSRPIVKHPSTFLWTISFRNIKWNPYMYGRKWALESWSKLLQG